MQEKDTFRAKMIIAAEDLRKAIKRFIDEFSKWISGIWEKFKELIERGQNLQPDPHLIDPYDWEWNQDQHQSAAMQRLKVQKSIQWKKQRTQQKNWSKWKKRKI